MLLLALLPDLHSGQPQAVTARRRKEVACAVPPRCSPSTRQLFPGTPGPFPARRPGGATATGQRAPPGLMAHPSPLPPSRPTCVRRGPLASEPLSTDGSPATSTTGPARVDDAMSRLGLELQRELPSCRPHDDRTFSRPTPRSACQVSTYSGISHPTSPVLRNAGAPSRLPPNSVTDASSVPMLAGLRRHEMQKAGRRARPRLAGR